MGRLLFLRVTVSAGVNYSISDDLNPFKRLRFLAAVSRMLARVSRLSGTPGRSRAVLDAISDTVAFFSF